MKKFIIAGVLCLIAVSMAQFVESIPFSIPVSSASDDVCKDCKDKSCGKGYSCYVKDGEGKCNSNKKPASGYTRCWSDGKKVNCNPCDENECRRKSEKCFVNSKGNASCLVPKGVNTNVYAECPTKYVEEGDICDGCEDKSCGKGHSCYSKDGKGSCKSDDKPPSGYTRCWSDAKPVNCMKCYSKKCSDRDQKCYVKSDGSASCKESKGISSKTYAECQTQYSEGLGDPKLKREYKVAKKAKSDAWDNYKSIKKTENGDYENKRKAAWIKYLREKEKELETYKAIKKSAQSRYKDAKKRAREKYLKIKTVYKTKYDNINDEYKVAKATYNKCEKEKGSNKCKDLKSEYKELQKKKKAALEEYEKNRSKEKKKYESMRNPAKKEYEVTKKDAKKTYIITTKALRATYDDAKAVALAEYIDALKYPKTVYKNAKKVYEKAKEAYEKSKKQ